MKQKIYEENVSSGYNSVADLWDEGEKEKEWTQSK